VHRVQERGTREDRLSPEQIVVEPRLLRSRGGHPHLDGVFQSVVNEGYAVVLALDAIDGHSRPPVAHGCLQDVDVVDRLPIPVVHPESLPFRGEARPVWGGHA
jgi:hypothetical protein